MSEKHKSGSKKRKHDKRAFSSSSSEEDTPKISNKKEKVEEHKKTKGPGPESKMKLRIRNYLNDNTDKAYIDYNDMAKSLHDKFPEYKRIKFKQFKVQVEECFNKILEALQSESQEPKKEPPKEPKKDPPAKEPAKTVPPKEPVKETPKVPAKETSKEPSKEKESKKNGKEIQVIHSSSENEGEPEKETRVAGQNMNQTMTKLYSTPSKQTDFEKIKSAAKAAEKTVGSNENKSASKPATEKKVEKKPEKIPEPPKEINKTKEPEGKVVAPITPKILSKEVTKPKEKDCEMIDLTEKSNTKDPTPAPQNTSTSQSTGSTNKSRPTSPTPQKSAKRRKLETAFKDSTVTFRNVAGMEDTLMDLLYLMIGLGSDNWSDTETLLLHGPTGCGKTLLANAIAGQLKWPMLEITATEIVSGVSGESEAKIRSLFDQAINSGEPCVLFMDEIEVIGQKKDGSSRGMDNRIIAQLKSCIDSIKSQKVLFVAATSSLESLDLPLRSRFKEVAIGIPNEKARKKIIEVVTADMEMDEDVDSAVLARNTPSYVGRDFQDLRSMAKKMAKIRIINSMTNNYFNPPNFESILRVQETCKNDERLSKITVKMSDFNAAIKKIQPAAKREGFATVPDVTWSDVGAMENVRKEIELKVLARVNDQEYAKELNLDSPTGVLLVGPPGCGKTLVAKAIANEAGINFISVKGPELLNMYVGESEKAVRQVFQRAKNSAPCVIFFDEIDALCPQRSGGSDHSGSNRVVTQMLTEMDGIEGREGVYIMGATNRENILDPAIKRPGRLETILYVGLPETKDRISILNALTKNKTRPPLAHDVDFLRISESCQGYSGADLKALVTKASEFCFSEGKDLEKMGKAKSKRVTKTHFEQALKAIRPSVQGKEKIRYEKARQELTPHYNLETSIDGNIFEQPTQVIQTTTHVPIRINRESLKGSNSPRANKESREKSVTELVKETERKVYPEAMKDFKFKPTTVQDPQDNGSEHKFVNETSNESGQKSANHEANKESIEESIQESVEKCLQVSSKKINSINENGDNDDIPDDMETSEVSDKIDLTDLKGLSVKITGDDRSVSVDTKEINDESIDENNDDDGSFSDYVPVSEQIEPGPVENGKIENDVEIKHENGEKTTEKEKEHAQEKVSQDLEEDFQPDYEPNEEDEGELRYLPKMAVRIKAIGGLPLGKVGMFGKVIKQVKGIVHVEADEDELEIPYKNLEPFMPDPGDKAKLLQKSESESVFEVLKYDEDDGEESVIVKNLDNNEESSVRLEHLCRIKV